MRNTFNEINKEITEYVGLAFAVIIGTVLIGAVANLAPANPAIQSLAGTYNFLARLLLDWNSPDLTLWSVRIIIGAAIAIGVYSRSEGSFR